MIKEKDPEDIMRVMETYNPTWSDLMRELDRPNPNWLQFHLKRLIREGRVRRIGLGDIMIYSAVRKQ